MANWFYIVKGKRRGKLTKLVIERIEMIFMGYQPGKKGLLIYKLNTKNLGKNFNFGQIPYG